jgi:hypothetical protein
MDICPHNLPDNYTKQLNLISLQVYLFGPLHIRRDLVRMVLGQMVQQHGTVGALRHREPGRELAPTECAAIEPPSRGDGVLNASALLLRSEILQHRLAQHLLIATAWAAP